MRAGFFLFIVFFLHACKGEPDPFYRDQMRDFVGSISAYAKERAPGFIVIPQNGVPLVTMDGEPDGEPHSGYLEVIDGQGQEDLFFGYREDNRATPSGETDYLLGFLRVCEQQGTEVMVTDYCSGAVNISESFNRNKEEGFISFAASERELNVIPATSSLNGENSDSIADLAAARNFLYLINPERYNSAVEFADAVTATNYDLLITDLFFKDAALSPETVQTLKEKANGGTRLVIAYMSIGEAEDYRYYWNPAWKTGEPAWLDKENPDWEGNYRVKYWDTAWQDIILGGDASYLDRIIAAGFDGVYLDIVEAFETYE